MRLIRILLIALSVALIVGGLIVISALRNRRLIVQVVLGRISQRAGVEITISRSRLRFRNHLVVFLDRPRMTANGREIAQLDTLRVLVSYHSLIYNHGLPLFALIADHPIVRIPAQTAGVTAAGLPRLDSEAVTKLDWALQQMTDMAQRVEVFGATLLDEHGAPLVEHLDITAHREHRRRASSPWMVGFDAAWQHAPLSGYRVAGDLNLGVYTRRHPNVMSLGHIWFWGLDLDRFDLAGMATSAVAQGSLHFVLSPHGELSGTADFDLRGLVLNHPALTGPLKLGDYSIHSGYRATTNVLELSNFGVNHSGAQVLNGSSAIGNPYDPSRTVSFRLGAAKIALTQMASLLHSFRRMPPYVLIETDRLRRGTLTIENVSIGGNQPLEQWTIATIRNQLSLQATLDNASYEPAPEHQLPTIEQLGASVSYSGGKLAITQGSMIAGRSSLSSVDLRADLRRAARKVPFTLALRGQFDMAELYAAARASLGASGGGISQKLTALAGDAPVEAKASGDLRELPSHLPQRFLVKADLSQVQATINGAPAPIALSGGDLTIDSTTLHIHKVVAAPMAPGGGNFVVDGTLGWRPKFPTLGNLSMELHGIDADQWLPLFVPPARLSAKGPLGGKLTAAADKKNPAAPIVTGALHLGTGEIQLGFLRSPMITQSATLTLDGKGLLLDIPDCRLEGAPLQFKLSVADFAHPVMRIDADAARLDFQVMQFVRLPWSPRTAPNFFPMPVVGHITARAANFDRLQMTRLATDFSHDDVNWRVYNFVADGLGGHIALDIWGRGRDDWIRIKGEVAGLQAGDIFKLSRPNARPPLIGQLHATADVWANTDVDFFGTLAGTAAIDVRNGTLNRFTLLTRVLSFIDVKNWITANFPDPRTVGVPFKKLTATFKGQKGDFYTDDLRLDGPVIDIIANGDLRFEQGTMDMQIGLIPFNTVNWMVRQIPLIGKHVARGSRGLVAAYFKVHGPFENPSVSPRPITSVAEFVLKTLSLPLNIVAPDPER